MTYVEAAQELVDLLGAADMSVEDGLKALILALGHVMANHACSQEQLSAWVEALQKDMANIAWLVWGEQVGSMLQ